MATGLQFTSTNISSEEVFDFACTLCAKQNKNTEATKFCLVCREYLCSGCTESHNKFPLMAGHVLEKPDLNTSNKTLGQYILTELCPKHPAEIIKMYCAGHDKVTCTVCTTIDHKACKDIHYIPDVAGTLCTKQMKTDTNTALLKTSEKMRILKEMCNKALHDLDSTKETALQAIQKFRQELNQMLDKLEENTKQQLDDQYQTLHKQWQGVIEKGTAISYNLQKQLDQLQNNEYNTSQQFVLSKMSKENISLADTMCRQLLPSSIQITFSQSEAIKSCLEQLSSFGNVSHSIDKGKLGLYNVKELHKHNIRIKSDTDTCMIWGSCVLESGHLLLADNRNNKLKLFDINKNAVTSYCALPGSVTAVCTVSDVEAAVSLNNQTVQYVSISNGMLPTRIVKLDHRCWGLAIDVDKMYITDTDTLYVHELNGNLLRTINKDQTGWKIFSDINHLTVSCSGNIHVTDNNYGLITLDTQGQVKWKYSGSDLERAIDVCTDGYENVFVCGYRSRNVLQLGHDGQRLGELLNKMHVSDPTCVLFDKRNCRLIITSDLKDYIVAFSLK